MAEAQEQNGEEDLDPDLVEDNVGENEPPAEPPPPKEKQEECPACEVGAPAWMATFADMATLLMAFFVLILSFASVNVPKFEQVAGSIKLAFGGWGCVIIGRCNDISNFGLFLHRRENSHRPPILRAFSISSPPYYRFAA